MKTEDRRPSTNSTPLPPPEGGRCLRRDRTAAVEALFSQAMSACSPELALCGLYLRAAPDDETARSAALDALATVLTDAIEEARIALGSGGVDEAPSAVQSRLAVAEIGRLVALVPGLLDVVAGSSAPVEAAP